VPASGPAEIDEHRAWPSPLRPQGGWVSAHLKGNATALRVTLYSVNLSVVERVEGPGAVAGWARVALPPQLWQGLASGTYFYAVEAQDDGGWHPAPRPGRLVFIR